MISMKAFVVISPSHSTAMSSAVQDSPQPSIYESPSLQDENQSSSPSESSCQIDNEQWNHPRSNIAKTLATFWSFLIMGANDSAYGLETYYNLSYTIVSLVFLSPALGYATAAIVNERAHCAIGRRGVAFVSSMCHLIAYILNCVHPPYPVLVVSFIFAGLGNGLADSAWNAWIGNLNNANQLLGLLHGFYGVGAVISPLIASLLVADAGLPWYYFYYIMIGGAAIEVLVCVACFWDSTGASFLLAKKQQPGDTSEQAGLRKVLTTMPSARITWVCSIFLLGYVGVEVALGGWIVTFMKEVRHAAPFPSSMTATGFWLGITVGRVILGFVTPLIGEKIAISAYISLEIAFCLILYLVPNFYAGAVAISLQGFFLGPLFPAVVIVTTKLLPKHLHVSAIGFAAAFGGCGAAVLPFIVGVLAQAKGVLVLMPFTIALSGAMLLLWNCLPGIPRDRRASANNSHGA
ncbi:hypothetical protein N7489_008060 [Penicillium chrysogenum]|uniref:uncharacterized protein n=1 Tax=Penicillium chrysogenum TaxID=5076 RepID=UPI0023A119D8|nr:uncharacterized protein N7489_008060 [Penicillium chrysogenum]KAJ5237969.1 hypothetical protein N7489_008060 [Penicillium chrysogenum]KAJ5278268.1 hypothetical protein N7524_004421 [Penicillium chrysogenum]